MITSMAEVLNLFPTNVVQSQGHEYKAPCPFCSSGTPHSITRNGHTVTFYGEDRLLIDDKGMYCRRCNSESRGFGKSTKGWYPHRAIGELFDTEVSDELTDFDSIREVVPLETWTLKEVIDANNDVNNDYWADFYWDEATVHKFRLGFGKLSTYPRPGHVIPMRVQNVLDDSMPDGFYMHLRAPDGEKRRLKGSSRDYIWRINWEMTLSTVLIVEGEKDGITASLLGFNNIIPLFGVTNWNAEKVAYLKRHNMHTVYSILDNDQPGMDGAEAIIGSVRRDGMTSVDLRWTDIPEGVKDLTDLFVHFKGDVEATLDYITKRWVKYPALETTTYLVEDEEATTLTIDDIRGDGPDSLKYNTRNFIDNYDLETSSRTGAGLMLHVGPGAGKTHTLVREAEAIARQTAKVRQLEYQGLLDQLEAERAELDPSGDAIEQTLLTERISELEDKVEQFSHQSIAWFGMYKDGWKDILRTGADPALWYNYEARTEANCENIKVVNKLGKNHHNIGKFCRTGCPFRQKCHESGYMAQDKKARKKPITFFRHQHLHGSFAADYHDLVVVDEYPGGILDNTPIRFKRRHMDGHHSKGDTLDYDDGDQLINIERLVSALRGVMADNADTPRFISVEDEGRSQDENPDWRVSGAAFLRRLDNKLRMVSSQTLAETIELIDRNVLHNVYQPTMAAGDENKIKLRCIPQLYDAIQRELPMYMTDHMNSASTCIHLEGDEIEFFDAHHIKVRNTTPIIAADATGIPSVYEAMFKRKFQKYNPRFQNPNAITVVVNKHDWTKRTFDDQIGDLVRSRDKMSKKVPVNMLGDGVIPANMQKQLGKIYDTKIIHELIDLIKYISDQHPNLLIVTHKNIRELLESIADGQYSGFEFTKKRKKKVSWAHYASLRGSNKYEDYEAVLLIGAFRIPYQVLWKKIQMWAWLLGITEPIPYEIVKKKMLYDSTDIEGRYYGFGDNFADSYLHMVERGEMIQSAERIRPHSSKGKKVIYILAERPALTFVSKVMTKTEFFRQFLTDTHTEAKDFMRSYEIRNKKYPTYGLVERQYKIAPKTISKIKKELQKEKDNDSIE